MQTNLQKAIIFIAEYSFKAGVLMGMLLGLVISLIIYGLAEIIHYL